MRRKKIDMKYFRINFGCGCGENEEILTFETLEAAENYAYESAIEDYHSYEGLHGVRDEADIAQEMFFDEDDEDYDDWDWDWDSLSDEQKRKLRRFIVTKLKTLSTIVPKKFQNENT